MDVVAHFANKPPGGATKLSAAKHDISTVLIHWVAVLCHGPKTKRWDRRVDNKARQGSMFNLVQADISGPISL